MRCWVETRSYPWLRLSSSRSRSRGLSEVPKARAEGAVIERLWSSAPALGGIRLKSGQVSRGSAGEYQADERAGVAGLSWTRIFSSISPQKKPESAYCIALCSHL